MKTKSYDILSRGLNWELPDGTQRREEAGATCITDLLPGDIAGLLKDGLIRESETQRKVAKTRSRKVAPGSAAGKLNRKSKISNRK